MTCFSSLNTLENLLAMLDLNIFYPFVYCKHNDGVLFLTAEEIVDRFPEIPVLSVEFDDSIVYIEIEIELSEEDLHDLL